MMEHMYMRYQLPDNVHDMLCSDELEMVQLGANLMTHYVPKDDWVKVLEIYQNRTYGEDRDIYIHPIKRWAYKIEDGVITISTRYRGLWDQLDPAYKRTYKISTGLGGMKLLKTAISEYFKNQQNGKETSTGDSPK